MSITTRDRQVAYTITVADLDAAAGRPLTEDEVRRVAAAIGHSSIPDALVTITGSIVGVPEEPESTRDERARDLNVGDVFREYGDDEFAVIVKVKQLGDSVRVKVERSDGSREWSPVLDGDEVVEVIA